MVGCRQLSQHLDGLRLLERAHVKAMDNDQQVLVLPLFQAVGITQSVHDLHDHLKLLALAVERAFVFLSLEEDAV